MPHPLLQHLPALFVAAVAALSLLLLGGAVRAISFAACGTYAAWFYLRFLQAHDSGLRWGAAAARQHSPLSAQFQFIQWV